MAQLSSILKVLVSFQLMFLQVTEILSVTKIERIDDVPFIVGIWFNEYFHCAGAIVSQRQIVTAAHCVDWVDPENINEVTVVEGVPKESPDGVKHNVSRIKIHPNYNRYLGTNSIAVVELETCLSICPDEIPPLCNEPIKVGDEVQTFGWENQDGTSSSRLQSVRVSVVDNAKCENELFMEESMFCSEHNNCIANKGGPALVNGKLCGIELHPVHRCSDREQRVYADIIKLRSFLDDALTL